MVKWLHKQGGGGGEGGVVTVLTKESESVSKTILFCALHVHCHFIKL